jgi:hypothetical protein
MVEGERDGWRLAMWDAGAATVLRAARVSGDGDALKFADEVANRAAARGHDAWLNALTGVDP